MPYKDPAARKAANRARYLRVRDDPEFQAARRAYREQDAERQKIRMAEWYALNPDAVREKQRAYYRADPEPRRAAARAYYAARRDDSDFMAKQRAKTAADRADGRQRVWAQAYKDRNRDKIRAAGIEYARRWRAEHPDEIHAFGSARRARLKSAPQVEKIDRRVVFERDGWVCQICGEPTDTDGPWGRRPGVDHIVPLVRGGAHTYANVQTAHRSCNSRKWAH